MTVDDPDDTDDGSSTEPRTEEAPPTLADLLDAIDPAVSGTAEREADPPADGDAGSSPSLRDLAEAVRDRERRSDRTARTGRSELGTEPPHDEPAPESDGRRESLRDASNVLLLGPTSTPAEHDACATLLDVEAGERVNLLLVTLGGSTDERIADCRRSLGDLPGTTTVVSAGDSVRSGKTASMTLGADRSLTIKPVPDPTDLMRIGITISKTLSEWERNGRRTVVCVHSVTALLQLAKTPRAAFRFLHVLRGQVQRAGATAHYHMEADAHDDRILAAVDPLFDAVAVFDETGGLSVGRD